MQQKFENNTPVLLASNGFFLLYRSHSHNLSALLIYLQDGAKHLSGDARAPRPAVCLIEVLLCQAQQGDTKGQHGNSLAGGDINYSDPVRNTEKSIKI